MQNIMMYCELRHTYCDQITLKPPSLLLQQGERGETGPSGPAGFAGPPVRTSHYILHQN